jgi:hypothetical protein
MVSRETFQKIKLHHKLLSPDFVAGIISVAGSFTHTQTALTNQFGFQIKLPVQNFVLLELVRRSIGLKLPVKIYGSGKSEYALLLCRSKKELLKTIIPYCSDNLMGYKLNQMIIWKEKMINKN